MKQAASTSPLLTPLRVGAWELPNRVVMAPLTRQRCEPGRIPGALMAEYYRQRAEAGLILSEATSISPCGVGYSDSPGIWSEEQVRGWKLTTDAVHGAGGRIVLQLWHVGRISDPSFLEGNLPVAPSAIAAEGEVSQLRPPRPYVTPRALEVGEIDRLIQAYRTGAENAKLAGFDGVELHAANGYLPDQFLHAGSNTRNDEYGGSVENRAQFPLRALDALIEVWGADRVGLHLSPADDFHDMKDPEAAAVYAHLFREASRRRIAFIFCREQKNAPGALAPALRPLFQGAFIANHGYTRESGEAAILSGEADLVSYGIPFIANPDLVTRFAKRAAQNQANPSTFYSRGATGYTDYPKLES